MGILLAYVLTCMATAITGLTILEGDRFPDRTGDRYRVSSHEIDL